MTSAIADAHRKALSFSLYRCDVFVEIKSWSVCIFPDTTKGDKIVVDDESKS